MVHSAGKGAIFAAAMLWLCAPFSVLSSERPKVVSLDSCADQYVLALADDDQILALSRNADLPFSYHRQRAAGFNNHDGSAEAVLGLAPDIAVRTGVGDYALTSMLNRLGVATLATGLPDTLDQVKDDLRAFGKALNQTGRANALIGKLDARVQTIAGANSSDRRALYISPGGSTTGPDTFLGEVLRLSGLKNMMAEKGLTSWGQVDLESLVMDPPQVIVGSFFDARTGMADSWRLADHPAARRIMNKAQFIEVPSRLLACPAWMMLDAVELIRAKLGDGA